MADREGLAAAPVEAFTADALAEYLDEIEQDKAPATVKKERAALNRLAKYLHKIGRIDATEILMIETTGLTEGELVKRDALEETTWRVVKAIARARLQQEPRGRTSAPAARRDLAIVLALGDMGLRSAELRGLQREAIAPRRVDGKTPWLRVVGKGDKERFLPIAGETEQALLEWVTVRDAMFGPAGDLFPRLGRRRSDGTFPDAGGRLSGRGLRDVVRPMMLAAGVEGRRAHPHVLRHTYGTLYMSRPGARIEDLRILMGHASVQTTAVYVHKSRADIEEAVLANQAHASDVLHASAARRERRAARRRAA